jgi:hypothetical protein
LDHLVKNTTTNDTTVYSLYVNMDYDALEALLLGSAVSVKPLVSVWMLADKSWSLEVEQQFLCNQVRFKTDMNTVAHTYTNPSP